MAFLTQGARGVSSAESERATLSLEVSTTEARTREAMVILDEREAEAWGLRRFLATKEAQRQACFTGVGREVGFGGWAGSVGGGVKWRGREGHTAVSFF